MESAWNNFAIRLTYIELRSALEWELSRFLSEREATHGNLLLSLSHEPHAFGLRFLRRDVEIVFLVTGFIMT